jgi:hypothetical protein
MRFLLALTFALAAMVNPSLAYADPESDSVCDPAVTLTELSATCKISPDEVATMYSSDDGHHYEIVPSCELGGLATCTDGQSCDGPPPGVLYDVLRDGEKIGSTCLDDDAASALGQVTAGMVRKAFERLSWPQSELIVQPPDGSTLVGFATNFYTANTAPTTQPVTLLGRQIEIEATPTSYLWQFGDGTSETTSTPGAAYPHLLITHQYRHAHVTVHPRVDTTYVGRYRLGNGPWRSIPGTLTVAGPAGDLQVREAQGVLTDAS